MRRHAVATVIAAVVLGGLVVGAAACSSDSARSSASTSSSGPSAGSSPTGTPGPLASVPPGDANKPVAAVDGVVVTEKSFNDELNAIGSVPSYLDATDLQLTPSNVATRLPQGGFDPGYVRLLLRRRVLLALVEHELAARGITVSHTCRKVASDKLGEALADDPGEGAAFLAAFPASYRDELVTWNAEVRELQATLSGLPCDTTDPGAQDKIGTAYATWLDATLPTANIAVDATYGTWDTASGTILPPGGVAATTSVPG